MLYVYLIKFICGIGWKIEGESNASKGPYIVASKHLSVWETLFLSYYFKIPVYIVKRELLSIPIFGWYMSLLGMIGIDRSRGVSAIKALAKQTSNIVKNDNRVLIIFPQGTRTPITGTTKSYPYKKGIVSICSQMPDVPVLLVAHNASQFFGRNLHSIKRPGIITVKFMPPIKKQDFITNEEFLLAIESTTESETKKLL